MSEYSIEDAANGIIVPPGSLRGRVRQIMNELEELPEEARIAIDAWADNLFNNSYIRSVGYQEYLDSDSSLDQIWGAAAQLEELLEQADADGRELSDDELDAVRASFMQAANSRHVDAKEYEQPIEVIADHVPRMVAIVRRLNGR